MWLTSSALLSTALVTPCGFLASPTLPNMSPREHWTSRTSPHILKRPSRLNSGRVERLLLNEGVPTPEQGSEAWGSWANRADFISLTLPLPERALARDVCCEIIEGWLLIVVASETSVLYEDGVWGGEEVEEAGTAGGPPLLFGRLMQTVRANEMSWSIEQSADGVRELSVEIPKVMDSEDGTYATADCIFDETLSVAGEPCLSPGLSQGTLTMRLPSL